jgi:hypothetical protein
MRADATQINADDFYQFDEAFAQLSALTFQDRQAWEDAFEIPLLVLAVDLSHLHTQ